MENVSAQICTESDFTARQDLTRKKIRFRMLPCSGVDLTHDFFDTSAPGSVKEEFEGSLGSYLHHM
jgi:hypothetical protein